ncbi:MAG: flagellar basal body P-ring formation chaperone FlgA [Melioribacteraceae bacterium]
MLGLLTILFAFFAGPDKNFDARLEIYLNQKFEGYAKYEYQIVQLPVKYSKIEINEEKKSRLTKNYLYLPVKIYDSGSAPSNSILTIRVRLFKNVFASSKEIRRNEIIRTDNIEIKLAEVSMYEGRTLSEAEDLTNYRSRTLIKPGTIITPDMIEPLPAVFKGDKLKLHTGNTGVDVSVEVVARQDGSVGEIISVYSGGNKLYKGRVVDKNTITLVE